MHALARPLVATALAFQLSLVALADEDPAVAPFARIDPDWAPVSTRAGSGRSGTADGAATASEFVEPYGIASDSHGNLIVTDRYGQRVRLVAPDGAVSTIAGSGAPYAPGLAVPPGFSNGAASSARFDRPTAVAVGRDDTIYVADEGNHAIRTIRKGIVATLATMHQPISLALDSIGDLFVADYPQLKKVAANGTTTTLAVPGPVLSIATTAADRGKTLVVATPDRIMLVDPVTGTIRATHPLDATDSGEVPGRIGQIAAFDDRTVVFTDTYAQTVRLRTLTTRDYTRPIAGNPLQRNYSHGGGYRDGAGDQALFADPAGIAIEPDGTIAIADAGNRRIRVLGRFDADSAQRQTDLAIEYPATPPKKNEYRIILVGDSYAWTNLAWHESIGGAVQDGLAVATATCTRKPTVYVVRRDGLLPDPGFDLVDNVLGAGIANEIVYLIPEGGDTEAQLAAHVSNSTKQLAESGAKFLAVTYPESWDIASAAEAFTEYHYDLGIGVRQYQQDRRSGAVAAIQGAGESGLDLYPSFLAVEASADHLPLFETGDIHFTPAGAKVVANGILAKLVADHPWGTCAP